ncbi:MAG: repair protein RecN [Abditibacteriota bacterium]|nr:repair protein RecN [Abditibacteriota bacterium]
MLLELRIANLAIIDETEISCGPGLNILTGETGAGKSIVIDALGLLIGERAASEQVGTASSGKAIIEGFFDVSAAPLAQKYLQEQEIELDDKQLLIAREVSSDGRSRVRLNGRLATAATLRELGSHLLDLHGQHEHQLLLRPESHLGFLDAFGSGAHNQKQELTRTKYFEWREVQKRLNDLTRNEQQRAQRLDMLQFQAEEIDTIAPQAGEDSELLDERSRLMNAEKLRSAASLCRDALQGNEEPGALELLRQALKAGREIEGYDSSVSEWIEELQSAIYGIEDAASEAASYADKLDADPMRLEEIEVRLHRLTRLKRKYGDSIDTVLAHRAKIAGELAGLSISEDELHGLSEEVTRRQGVWKSAAEALSQSRHELAQRFSEAVVSHLRTLAMERARFEVHFERDENGSANGFDRVEFLLSANPGQPPRPLSRIASGGEISRVMLALRSVLSGTHRSTSKSTDVETANVNEAAGGVPVIIFDEIDVGIGGVTAEAVGEKMQELARHFQVFCVTHLPQIARRADRHYRVRKEADAHATRVEVQLLSGDERVRELARMMGRESDANLRHARELLNDGAAPVNAMPDGETPDGETPAVAATKPSTKSTAKTTALNKSDATAAKRARKTARAKA